MRAHFGKSLYLLGVERLAPHIGAENRERDDQDD
jgi:hypothetical protein